MATFSCFSPPEVREAIFSRDFQSRRARWTKRNRDCSHSRGILVTMQLGFSLSTELSAQSVRKTKTELHAFHHTKTLKDSHFESKTVQTG